MIDGHNIEEILKALDAAQTVKGKPTAIIAKTYKGKGLPGKKNLLSILDCIVFHYFGYILMCAHFDLWNICGAKKISLPYSYLC